MKKLLKTYNNYKTEIYISVGAFLVYYGLKFLKEKQNDIIESIDNVAENVAKTITNESDTQNAKPITKDGVYYFKLALEGLNTNTQTLSKDEWDKAISLESTNSTIREYGIKYGYASWIERIKWSIV